MENATRETRARQSETDYLIGSIVDGYLPSDTTYRMEGEPSSSDSCGNQGTTGSPGGGGDSCSGPGTHRPPHGGDD